jgi:hypothetical protein
VVKAQVSDPDGLSSLVLLIGGTFNEFHNREHGQPRRRFLQRAIVGQPSGTMVAFS